MAPGKERAEPGGRLPARTAKNTGREGIALPARAAP